MLKPTGRIPSTPSVMLLDEVRVLYCVAYTKCKATLWYHLIYLFIYLFVYESRVPVMWPSVCSKLVVLVVSLGLSNFFR